MPAVTRARSARARRATRTPMVRLTSRDLGVLLLAQVGAADVTSTFQFPNTATVTGDDQPEGGHEVTDDDDANAQILIPGHPRGEAGGPGQRRRVRRAASVDVGATVTYQLAVTNTATRRWRRRSRTLVVTLRRRTRAATRTATTCSTQRDLALHLPHVVTAADGDPFVNTATVTGTDQIGGKASDDDTATVRSRSAGPACCPGRGVRASPGWPAPVAASGVVHGRVSGRRIARVVFTIDGKRVKTLTGRTRAATSPSR